jgi:prevent-host-death family protein
MRTLHSEEAEARFSSVLLDVEAGDEVAITSGLKKQAVAVIVPYEKWKMSQKRRLGTLEGKMSVTFADDFAMTDEELVSL